MKGEVYKFHLEDWEGTKTGWVIDENKEWVLIHVLISDYIFDGFSLIRKKFITKTTREEHEKQIELVGELKNITHFLNKDFKFGNVIFLIKWIEKAFDMFEFQDDTEDELFIGTQKKIIRKEILRMNYIDTKGIMDRDFDYDFKIDKIRILSFDSDYFNSVKLLWKHKSKGFRKEDDIPSNNPRIA